MNYLYLDFEGTYTKDINLKSLTLRKYLEKSEVLGVSLATNDDPVKWFPKECIPAILEGLRELALDPNWTVVAHNAAFDIRVWRFKLGLPQPRHVHCTLELACAAYPNQAGGYGIAALSKSLNLGFDKLGDGKKVMQMTPEELAAYCNGDVELCRAIHKKCLARLHPKEIEVAELANAAREMWFEVDATSIASAQVDFADVAAESVQDAMGYLGADGEEAFGWEAGRIKSVKPAEMKRLLFENLGFSTQSISHKKINPAALAENAAAAGALKGAERANKALSHGRRLKVFNDVAQVDVELGYFRAHTGRFSSPSVGRGLNLHNLSKRDKKIAKLIRSIFRMPSSLCMVRGDLANVEYRVEGLLTGSAHCVKLFAADIMADPYAAFWYAATGQIITKAHPARQVAKAAVLGLGFLMGLRRWMEVIMLALAEIDPDTKKALLTLDDLRLVIAEQKWTKPRQGWVTNAQRQARAPDEVATIAYYTRELFHEIHPEFRRTADWLEMAIQQLNRCDTRQEADRCLYNLYDYAAAPSRDMIDVMWDNSFEGRTVRVRCGPWVAPTVTWRDIDIRVVGDGACMTYLNGKKGYWPLSKNVLIENCWAADTLVLTSRGWVPIVTLTQEDSVWDGEAWVHHGGLINQGLQSVGHWNGNRVTAEHRIFAAGEWCPVAELGQEKGAQAVASGLQGWTSYLTAPSALCGATGTPGLCPGATTPATGLTPTTVGEGSVSALNGDTTGSPFTGTPSRSPAGTNRGLTSTESTTPEGTSPGISGACLAPSTAGTGETRPPSNTKAGGTRSTTSTSSSAPRGRSTLSDTTLGSGGPQLTAWTAISDPETVYDIANCGPRHRFMVLTTAGPVIVHNCVQSAARNAMCQAQLALRDRGYAHQLTVHDEIMLVGQRKPEAVLQARADLIDVLGPNKLPNWLWSVCVNPDEINVSQSLYEVDMDKIAKGWWTRLPTEPQLLESLP